MNKDDITQLVQDEIQRFQTSNYNSGNTKVMPHNHDGINSPLLADSTNPVEAFAVGAIYINTTGTNPATELGYGTWSAYAAGRVLVAYSAGDPDFGTGGQTGGVKVVTLGINEMPVHVHGTADLTFNPNDFGGGSNIFKAVPTSGSPTVYANTGQTGGGASHNNVQPYIVVYFWNRTA